MLNVIFCQLTACKVEGVAIFFLLEEEGLCSFCCYTALINESLHSEVLYIDDDIELDARADYEGKLDFIEHRMAYHEVLLNVAGRS